MNKNSNDFIKLHKYLEEELEKNINKSDYAEMIKKAIDQLYYIESTSKDLQDFEFSIIIYNFIKKLFQNLNLK